MMTPQFSAGEMDVDLMGLAMVEARRAAAQGEVPVGAVIVQGRVVVGQGYNRREELNSPLAHAEILAIDGAARHLGSWRLSECDIYVTLEPCIMCVGAILQARMKRLIFGCLDPKAGAVESLYRLCDDTRLNHRMPVTGRILEHESAGLLEGFFLELRKSKRNSKNAERWPSPAEGA